MAVWGLRLLITFCLKLVFARKALVKSELCSILLQRYVLVILLSTADLYKIPKNFLEESSAILD